MSYPDGNPNADQPLTLRTEDGRSLTMDADTYETFRALVVLARVDEVETFRRIADEARAAAIKTPRQPGNAAKTKAAR